MEIPLVIFGYAAILWACIRICELRDSLEKLENGVRSVEKSAVKCFEMMEIEIEQLQAELARLNERTGGDGK
jgi:hypothetical protein